METVIITRSKNKDKKLAALFPNGKIINFGAAGYSDYTIHNDDKRKQNYIRRHEPNEDWSNIQSAGWLSRYVLWNKPTLSESIDDINKNTRNIKFKLNI